MARGQGGRENASFAHTWQARLAQGFAKHRRAVFPGLRVQSCREREWARAEELPSIVSLWIATNQDDLVSASSTHRFGQRSRALEQLPAPRPMAAAAPKNLKRAAMTGDTSEVLARLAEGVAVDQKFEEPQVSCLLQLVAIRFPPGASPPGRACMSQLY